MKNQKHGIRTSLRCGKLFALDAFDEEHQVGDVFLTDVDVWELHIDVFPSSGRMIFRPDIPVVALLTTIVATLEFDNTVTTSVVGSGKRHANGEVDIAIVGPPMVNAHFEMRPKVARVVEGTQRSVRDILSVVEL